MPPAIQLRPNDTILFIGDSITAADRHRQAYAPLGFGYVHFAGNFLLAKYPQLNLRIVNTGVSGDTLMDVKQRWDKDCLAHRPNVVSVLVGINDVWQRTMQPGLAATAANPDEYEVTFGQLLARTRKQCNCRFVLIWSADTVHPYLWAHAWIAQRWLDTTGL